MLKVQALTYNNLAPVQPLVGMVRNDGDTIGRGDGNVLSLPDPMRVVSRRHLSFGLNGNGTYRVCNVGGGNPVFVNGQELRPGAEHLLKDRDTIFVGGYALQVSYVAAPADDVAHPIAGPTEASGSTGGEDDFLADLFGTASPISSRQPAGYGEDIPDPFLHGAASGGGDIMQQLNEQGIEPGSLGGKDDGLVSGEATRVTMDELLGNAPGPQLLHHDPGLDPLALLDDAPKEGAFDDILRPGKSTGLPLEASPRMDLTHGSELDALFQLPTSTGRPSAPVSPVNRVDEPIPVPKSKENPADFGIDDFLAGLGETPISAPESIPTPPPASTPPPVHTPVNRPGIARQVDREIDSLPRENPQTVAPVMQGAGTLGTERFPASVAQTAGTSPVPKVGPAPGTSEMPGMEELYRAFLEGLGMELPGRTALDKAFMTLLGQVLRHYTQGTVDLIAGRTVVKQSVRANVTVIAPERNNPLKFAPDGNAAILGMLGRTPPGFMGPVEAVRNAFVDLRAHQIGVISGMQAALNHVLDRFDPATLGGNAPAQSLVEDVLPMKRKARLWDEYGVHFQSLRERASDHFQDFFGQAFLEAYERAILTVLSGDRTGRP